MPALGCGRKGSEMDVSSAHRRAVKVQTLRRELGLEYPCLEVNEWDTQPWKNPEVGDDVVGFTLQALDYPGFFPAHLTGGPGCREADSARLHPTSQAAAQRSRQRDIVERCPSVAGEQVGSPTSAKSRADSQSLSERPHSGARHPAPDAPSSAGTAQEAELNEEIAKERSAREKRRLQRVLRDCQLQLVEDPAAPGKPIFRPVATDRPRRTRQEQLAVTRVLQAGLPVAGLSHGGAGTQESPRKSSSAATLVVGLHQRLAKAKTLQAFAPQLVSRSGTPAVDASLKSRSLRTAAFSSAGRGMAFKPDEQEQDIRRFGEVLRAAQDGRVPIHFATDVPPNDAHVEPAPKPERAAATWRPAPASPVVAAQKILAAALGGKIPVRSVVANDPPAWKSRASPPAEFSSTPAGSVATASTASKLRVRARQGVPEMSEIPGTSSPSSWSSFDSDQLDSGVWSASESSDSATCGREGGIHRGGTDARELVRRLRECGLLQPAANDPVGGGGSCTACDPDLHANSAFQIGESTVSDDHVALPAPIAAVGVGRGKAMARPKGAGARASAPHRSRAASAEAFHRQRVAAARCTSMRIRR